MNITVIYSFMDFIDRRTAFEGQNVYGVRLLKSNYSIRKVAASLPTI